ncbi:MAG: hypothetical protein CML33_03680 [Rhodobacteraceae bacterium]|nr:hypothetical protein [Paracoccaceae bacterium]|tara:strand:- start:1541 stop:1789 length:249 start_codon:yes stop_codon:yes gene_type:complete
MGKFLVPMPETVLAAIVKFDDEPKLPAAAFNPGNGVSFEEGPFAVLEAVFEISRAAERARVFFLLLGRQQRIEVSANHLAPR